MEFFKSLYKTIARNPELIETFKQDQAAYDTLLVPAKRFIVEDLEAALPMANEYEQKGYQMSLEYMGGEDTVLVEDCQTNTEVFIHLISKVQDFNKAPHICLDLSTIGLAVDKQITIDNLKAICQVAQSNGSTV